MITSFKTFMESKDPRDPYAAVNSAEYGEAAQRLKSIFNERDYQTFVGELQQNVNDPKIRKLIMSGLLDGDPSDDKVQVRKVRIPVTRLKPTQNEIGFENSLKNPITKYVGMIKPIIETGYYNIGSILTGGGSFIIDGHHRWSQIFCLNPEGMIDAIDLVSLTDPMQALKVTQMAIAGIKGNVPQSAAKGVNLLNTNPQVVAEYVAKTASDQAVQAFEAAQGNATWDRIKQNGDIRQAAGEYMAWAVSQMQANNQPVVNAPPRDFMPQTGDTMGMVSQIGLGKVNFAEPLVAAESFREWMVRREKRCR